ncbi:MFS transporter [Streptomyces sp. URMC 128]|uniref:MFS transporter n=1 Tax=Streptomyces sp. URMC 128 TaxID=3423404 RepID=UPI003F1D41F8
MTDVLRRGRASLAFGFLVQGVAFALLVTRIPAIQDRYGVSDALLPAFLAAVPILAGVASVSTERLVKRVPPSRLLRWSQPVVLLALLGVGAGEGMVELGVALAAFGLAVGVLDASMNMLGVSLQRSYGRSIMLSFHAAYSLGGIVGASLAWVGAHWELALWVSYLPVVAVLLPAVLVGSRWYVDDGDAAPAAGDEAAEERAAGEGQVVVFKWLLPLCLVMTVAYIGDSTVSNWSAKYLQDVLGSSEQMATVPYNVYMVTTLLGVGLCVLVPQTFAAAGRLFPGASDAAVARLNVFNYVGFLIGSPLVGALGDLWSYRGAMLVPMVLVLVTLVYARSFAAQPDRYGGGHERPRTADVGRGSNGL